MKASPVQTPRRAQKPSSSGSFFTDVVKAPFTFLYHETEVFLAFSWRDWSATLIPGSIFALGAMANTSMSPTELVSKYSFLVTWLTSYIYFFDLSNQITGVDEDVINKPDRPIPSGLVTLQGAKIRWVIQFLIFISIALVEPTLLPQTIVWIITVAFLCLTAAGSHWFGKNCVAMTTGTWALLSASWKCIAPATAVSDRYIYAVSLWTGLMTHIQDLRDIKGDAVVGRKTMPLVFGDMGSRWIITFLFLPTGFAVLWWGNIVDIAPYSLSAVHTFLGYRIMNARGAHYDHKTYMIYTYIFCLLLAFTAINEMNLDARVVRKYAETIIASGLEQFSK